MTQMRNTLRCSPAYTLAHLSPSLSLTPYPMPVQAGAARHVPSPWLSHLYGKLSISTSCYAIPDTLSPRWALHGTFRSPSAPGCSGRAAALRSSDWTYYSNEYTMTGGEDSMGQVEVCSRQFVTALLIRWVRVACVGVAPKRPCVAPSPSPRCIIQSGLHTIESIRRVCTPPP